MKRILLALHLVLAAIGISGAQEAVPTGPYASEEQYLRQRWDNTIRLSSSEALGLIRATHLIVTDQVSDGCWTNVSAVEAKMRAALERATVAVYLEPLATYNVLSPQITLNVLGYRTDNGLCVGHASMAVEVLSGEDLGSFQYTGAIFKIMSIGRLWDRATLFSGPSLNDQLLSQAEEWIDTLTADIFAAKRSDATQRFLSVWNKEMPTTKADFDKMLEEAVQEIENSL
jgi:hypothetical protein